MSSMPDAELVRQVLAGQTVAYGDLVRRHAARLLAICRAHVANADAAQDLAQEAFLRALQALPSLTDPVKFGAWLRGIAVRVCLDWRKAKQTAQVPFSALENDSEHTFEVADDAEPVEQKLERSDHCQQLMAAMHVLPLEYREVLLLYYYDDVTYQDLANLLGVSRATINLRLTKGRALLREALSRSVR
jgi:RNA polymerase sigma-70 factor (ECF subfamily)